MVTPIIPARQPGILQRILAGLPGAGMRAAVSGAGLPTPAGQPAPRPMVVQPNPADQSLAKALAAGAYDNSPIETGMELGGRLAQAWAGQKLERDYAEKERNKYSELTKALAGAPDAKAAAKIAMEDPRLMPWALETLHKAPAKTDYIKVGHGDFIYDPNAGKWITPPTGGAGGGVPMFDGKSVEGQSLNFLISKGIITPEQAADFGAGKTITGQDGSLIFMTPRGVFAKPANGGAAVPVPTGAGNATGSASNVAPVAAKDTQARDGLIPLTGPKTLGTDEQMKAAGFSDRMINSEAVIGSLEEAGTSLPDKAASGIPVAGNYLVSGDYQKLDQARRDFVNAVLRRESGAVISDQEFDNANKQYFPQPGDSKETIAQKRENRRIATEGMVRSAGPNFKPKPASAGDAPPPGTVMDGYRFKGGNPADKTNWEKVQ